MRGVYAGSFDPPTRGHINIMQRAARLCDELLIGVGDNISKTYMFSKEERVRLVSAATESLSNTEVLAFDGLLADFCVENNVDIIFRGTGMRLTPATSRRWPRPYTTYPEFR
jgi:pantetheine-phosphate adenylyltransferase